jgi:organic hydroperoxide reductase OsmC/OhrA
MSVNKIELNPKISFQSNFSVLDEEMTKMQDRSHRYCFIVNSLYEEVKLVIN